MIKLTFEAETMSELFEDIETFLQGPPNTSTPTPPAEAVAPKEKKLRKVKEEAPAAQTTASAPTPLDVSNAERQATPAAIIPYTDLSKAVMEVVKKHDKPAALAILRTFKHKDGADLVVNAPTDIVEADYASVIAAMDAKAKEEKAA